MSMTSTVRFDKSHEQVPQLQEVYLGEHGHRHEVQSSDEVGHAGYQIGWHGKPNQIRWSHAQVLQLLVVELGENVHSYQVQNSDEVGYEWYQIGQHSK